MGKAARRKPARLPAKLVHIRRKLKLSQNELIRKLGLEEDLEQQYISKFEHGILEPPLYVLCAYADLANVTLDLLARDSLKLPKEIPVKGRRTR